ncbi:tudor domain-containing protein 5-like isoform X2 [Hyla sarda]|uniref:tudor domain-containing protein 5-like isoform X2 n=1 Tax=Hyla sarda TaxID=327740 RepID=UPI0024C37555|nr:tudor domain-containing protein 5-like isoform X2 [Hyla sarda]
MGFMSVLELVGALGDILCIEDPKDGQDWRLFDIELKRKKDVDGERTDKKKLNATDGLITRWNVTTTPKPERLKPPAIISPSDGQSLWSLPPGAPVSDHQIPPDAVRKQKLCALSHMKRGFMMGVYVENVTSPSNFYVRCYSKETSQKLEDMMIEMRFCYSNEHVSRRYIVPDEYMAVGEVYALSVDEDVWWYRVIVHSIISPHEVQVFYPDFGTLATVKRCWLRFLKACYMRLPAQAVPAALACLKPVEDRWSAEATKLFQSQCARGPLVGVVMQYVSDHLCLFLCDTSSDEDIYLHQVLINAGHASLAPEPGIYSVNKEPEPELPYLEAFPIGEDIWDEVWSFSGGTVTPDEALKPTAQDLVKHQEETTVPGKINDIPKRSDGERLSQPLEEFYISLIKSRNVSEKSAALRSPPRKCEESEKTVQPAPDTKDPFLPLIPEKENLQTQDDNLLFCESSSLNQTAAACNPLTGFQKFQIPRRSATVALGPAARLAATPGSLSHWGY